MTQDPNSTWFMLVMHELRTPLTAASGYLELALNIARQRQTMHEEESPSSPDFLDVFLRLAAQELAYATAMLADLMVAQGDDITIQLLPCHLGDIVREVVETRKVLLPTRILDVHVQDVDSLVLADPRRIKQVLTNYLVNALKYAPADRPISLLVEQIESQFVRVLARDEGPRIALEEQPHLWEKGYRVLGGSQGHEGLGLGLYICRLLIERQGGIVGLDSSPGQGASFWFQLPALPMLPQVQQEPDPAL